MPQTIDNLGPEHSRRYAENQKLYDASFQDAAKIPSRTQVPSLSPSTGALEQVFQVVLTVLPRALFSPPPSYFEKTHLAFTSQLTAFIGPDAKWDAISEKVLHLVEKLPESSEKKSLKNFFETATKITQSIVAIKTRISQYHRG